MSIKWGGKSGQNLTTTSDEAKVPTEIYGPGEKSPLDLSDPKMVRDYVESARDRMGLLARRKFDRATNKEIQEIASNVAINYIRAERQLLLDKIAADVSVGQREIFRAFVGKVIKQDLELVRQTNKAEEDLTFMVQDEVLSIIQKKKEQIDQVKRELDAGRIMEADYEKMCDMYAQAAEDLIKRKFEKVNKVSQDYLEHFENAMKKYKEKALKSGGAIMS